MSHVMTGHDCGSDERRISRGPHNNPRSGLTHEQVDANPPQGSTKCWPSCGRQIRPTCQALAPYMLDSVFVAAFTVATSLIRLLRMDHQVGGGAGA